MKKINPSFINALVIATAFSSASAFAMIDPTAVLITVYGIAVSPNADCSNAKVVSTFSGGKQFDFMQTPSLLSGAISEGTYPCVIMSMSSNITFTPASTSGNCTASTSYTRDVCSGSCSYTPTTFNADNTVSLGSVTTSAAANSQDLGNAPKVAVFLSTGSTNPATNQCGSLGFLPPTDANNSTAVGLGCSSAGFPLSGALNVFGVQSGTFVVDFHGKVDGTQNPCDVQPPTFSFR